MDSTVSILCADIPLVMFYYWSRCLTKEILQFNLWHHPNAFPPVAHASSYTHHHQIQLRRKQRRLSWHSIDPLSQCKRWPIVKAVFWYDGLTYTGYDFKKWQDVQHCYFLGIIFQKLKLWRYDFFFFCESEGATWGPHTGPSEPVGKKKTTTKSFGCGAQTQSTRRLLELG